MKKIGQLTFHASHNYGSVLQAYALSRQLQIMGYDTEYINLRPQSQRDAYKIITGRGIHRAFHYFIYLYLKRRYDKFERFITEVLPISEIEYSSTEELRKNQLNYDVYVCGGDQIWNPCCQDFETAYYLQFLSDNDPAKRIAYAPSFGKSEFDEQTINQISEWLKSFDSISVREKSGENLILPLTDKKVEIVCDPVILIDRCEWERIAVPPKYKKPYILVYFLENNHGKRDLIEQIKKTTGFDVVLLNEYIRDFIKPYHKAYATSPEEFVGLFMHASFVYTNSFHGTAFATVFEKPFITAVAENQENAKNNNDSRKIDYLKKIGLDNRLYRGDKIDCDSLLHVDYSKAKEIIDSFRKQSYQYLSNALKG